MEEFTTVPLRKKFFVQIYFVAKNFHSFFFSFDVEENIAKELSLRSSCRVKRK